MKFFSTIVLLGVFGSFSFTYGLTNGEECNASTVCDKEARLICSKDTNKCSCTSGVLTESINYTFEWNDALKKCLAVLQSGCIGTIGYEATDLPKDVKAVECSPGLVCTQVENLPPLVGVCTTAIGDDGGCGSLAATSLIFYLASFLLFGFYQYA